MNNFWFLDGNFTRLGYGNNGVASTYNTYDDGNDHLRFISPSAVEATSINGTDNDGSDLGGNDYRIPSATGLNLFVTTGVDQNAAQAVQSRLMVPLGVSVFGQRETAPEGQYGSPFEQVPGTIWTSVSYTWQNPSINNVWVGWRVKLCDLTGNCAYTSTKYFAVGAPTDLGITAFAGSSQGVPPLAWGGLGLAALGLAFFGGRKYFKTRTSS